MPERFPPADLSRVKTYPLAERANKVRVDEFARPVSASSSLPDFLDGLPDILLTEFGRCRLFLNQGSGRFRDLGAQAGIDSPLWATKALF